MNAARQYVSCGTGRVRIEHVQGRRRRQAADKSRPIYPCAPASPRWVGGRRGGGERATTVIANATLTLIVERAMKMIALEVIARR